MTSFAEIGQSIAKFAPLLGGVVAGPAGAAIGSIVAAKFGGTPDDLDDLSHRIDTDPDREIKLRQIESDNEVQLQNLIVTAENNRLLAENARIKIEVDNVISARQREVDLAKANTPDNTPKTLALFYTAGFFFVMLLYTFYPALRDNMVITALASGEMLILGYYFGSSVGSKIKDDTLANAIRH